MMSDNYQDFRDEMVARFPSTPLIAVITHADGDKDLYGAFANGQEAMDWLLTIPMNVRVAFHPLRNPHMKRDYDDFYNPQKLRDPRNFDHTENNHATPV